MNYSYADGNTGYPTREPGGLKNIHNMETLVVIILTCPLNCMHMEMVADIIESQEGIQGRSVERIYFHHMLGYTMS
jgi:hypothetical protein